LGLDTLKNHLELQAIRQGDDEFDFIALADFALANWENLAYYKVHLLARQARMPH
jgi:hypothetical protein